MNLDMHVQWEKREQRRAVSAKPGRNITKTLEQAGNRVMHYRFWPNRAQLCDH